MVMRSNGSLADSLTVKVRTWEPNHGGDVPGFNTTELYHDVTFAPGSNVATVQVVAKQDVRIDPPVDTSNPWPHTLNAEVAAATDSSYELGTPSSAFIAIVDINATPYPLPLITIQNSGTPLAVTEGNDATFTLSRTGGDLTQPQTVGIRVNDPDGYLRGNHWDTEPDFPTTVEFAANFTTQTMTVTVSDDQRDLTDGDIIVNVLTSSDYLLGNTGQGTSAEVVVTDNDDAQELTFDWGYVDYEDSWGQGESWLYQQGSVWVSGPAEGLFYYNNDRTWRFDHGADEYFPIHFQVKRRSQDKGKTATFVVRVEHNRGWVHPRHSATDGWSTDPETGWRYKDYPISLEGNQQQVMGRIEILDNGLPDPEGWSYRASIRQIEDVNGVTLSADQEAKYWTVDGVRSRHSDPFDRGYPEVTLERVGPHMVDEGQTVEFEVERLQGNSLADLPVRVRTWEPNRRKDDGTNPTDQVHTVTLPAVAMTSDWTNYYGYGNLSQSVKFSVTITRDYEYEPLDFLKAEILPSPEDLHDSRDRTQYRIRDLDRPTITLSASPTSITEGEPVTFTLTRSVNTTEDLIVRVSIDDPGGFLEGNSPAEAVTMPTNVAFAPGAVTMDIIVTPPDDWRDIPDSTLTFTVITEPEYNNEGSASATVQMADNDVAPQVGISFSHDVVEEGNDLILTITRTGEDKNPLRVPITAGPKGEQERVVVTLAAGESSQQVVFSRADDDRKTPDVEYEATLHAGQPEFWTTTGSTTINAIVNDDDLYRVGIEMLTPQVNEGQYIPVSGLPRRTYGEKRRDRTAAVRRRQRRDGLRRRRFQPDAARRRVGEHRYRPG